MPPPSAPPAGTAVAPWQIPAAALGSQRLFRLRIDGPDGEATAKLTLRLAAVDRYRAELVDALGRPLWSFAVDGSEALWLDHRERRACRIEGGAVALGPPFGALPLPALPPLLLGRLPAAPAGDPAGATPADDGPFEFRDREGRRWTGEMAAGRPLRWTLWEGDAGRAGWLADGGDGEAILSDRLHGVQIRWREVVAEPLAAPPEPLERPADYREVACARTPPPI